MPIVSLRSVAALFACAFWLNACSPPAKEPEFFLPEIIHPFGESLEDARKKYCSPERVSFRDGFLTEQNIRNVFQCANYDKSLDGLRGVFESGEVAALLSNINILIGAESTKNIRDTLGPWFEPNHEGRSKIDRLLPLISSTIKNKAFQDGLPVLTNILDAGNDTWTHLLPAIADVLYTPRFPDNFEDILLLWQGKNSGRVRKEDKKEDIVEEPKYAESLKKIAKLLLADINGKTGARTFLELLDDVQKVKLPHSSLTGFLHELNVKNVFLSMYQESGNLRGETMNPKLNADPDMDELEQGLTLTPEQRRERIYRKIFSSENGEPPIVQLSKLVAEFHRPHPEFLSAISNWYSANGAKVKEGLNTFVARSIVVEAIPEINLERFLSDYFSKSQGRDLGEPIEAPAFVAALKDAFNNALFDDWLEQGFRNVNREQFGPINERALRESSLKSETVVLYRMPQVSEFGKTIFPRGKPLPIASAIKRYSNLHRADGLQILYKDKNQNIENHMMDLWLDAANNHLGENIIMNFAVKLTQTFFTDFAANFAKENPGVSLAQWYFSSTYSNPSSTESLVSYAFKELNLMKEYEKHKDYLKDTFGPEVFKNPHDLRAFRMIVDQIPNIYLYVRSGMSRSGNDLTRALSEKDKGHLIRSYVNLLVSAVDEGLVEKAVPLLSSFMSMEDLMSVQDPAYPEDSFEDRERISDGSDALKRVLNSLFRPEKRGYYDTALFPQILAPLAPLVSNAKIDQTEKFLLASANEILNTDDAKLNDFFSALDEIDPGQNLRKKRNTTEAVAELLKKNEAPEVIRQLSKLFKDDAVKPALDYLATKIDDGTLDRILFFIARVLGIRN